MGWAGVDLGYLKWQLTKKRNILTYYYIIY